MTFENESEERNVSFLGSVSLSYFVLCRQLLSFMVVSFVFDSYSNVFSITLLCNEVDCTREWSLRKERREKVKLYFPFLLLSSSPRLGMKIALIFHTKEWRLCFLWSSLLYSWQLRLHFRDRVASSLVFSFSAETAFLLLCVQFLSHSCLWYFFSLRTRNGSLFTLTFHYKEDGGHVFSSLTRGIAFSSLLFYFTSSFWFILFPHPDPAFLLLVCPSLALLRYQAWRGQHKRRWWVRGEEERDEEQGRRAGTKRGLLSLSWLWFLWFSPRIH